MADHSDDLDELLDSALDDFQTLNLASASQGGVNTVKKESVDIKQASTSKLAGGSVQGLGMGLPDLNNRKKTKQKPPQTQDSHISEALDKLREQTREAVRGLEAVAPPPQPDNFGTDAMMEDWVKQFEAMAGGQLKYIETRKEYTQI